MVLEIGRFPGGSTSSELKNLGISELPSGFLGSVLDLKHRKDVAKLVIKNEPLPVGATTSQLLTMGFSLLPPGFLNFLLEMSHN